MLPKKLHKKIEERKENNAFRQLGSGSNLVDFSSNDYLGFSKSETIFNKTHQYLTDNNLKLNGATGSRLLSGNHKLYDEVETSLSKIHNTESALIFNSGYDANLGLLSSVPQRGDVIIYDELCHASMRDGISMSNAKSYKFKHNDLEDLQRLLKRPFDCLPVRQTGAQGDRLEIYVITESVFSMDGDAPDLTAMSQISKAYNANLIIDEAHALGVFNYGLVQQLGLEQDVFARLITFGKALGCHGAAILGSKDLKNYLINFSRSFIYTTALPPHTLATIKFAYEELVFHSENEASQVRKLERNISYFKKEVKRIGFQKIFIPSDSAIQCCIISGNETVKSVASTLQDHGYDVKPILSPTVPEGKERLRFCLHSYNSKEEITEVLSLLATFANQ